MWASMRKSLPSNCHATRIENRHGGGIPDVHLAWNGVSVWVELKSENKHNAFLRPQQSAWHLRQATCGGLTYVLCGCPRSPLVKIYRGSDAALAGSAGLLCAPALVDGAVMEEALRLMRDDALRLSALRLADPDSAPLREKAPTPSA